MKPPSANNPSIQAAESYVSLGFRLIVVPARSKNPGVKEWQKHALTSTDGLDVRFRPRKWPHLKGEIGELLLPPNMGILLGDQEITDVDLDCPEAIAAAGELLPETRMKFGRKSKPASHYFYRTDPPSRQKGFYDPLAEKKTKGFVQLRGLKADGTQGLQTVVPPGIHEEGEEIRWEPGCGPTPANIEAEKLKRAVAETAAAALLARHWPGEDNGRNPAFLALAGCAVRAGWTLEQAKKFHRATYCVLWGPQADLHQADAEVEATFKKHDHGEDFTGLTTLKGLIDKRVVYRVCEWLGWSSFDFSQKSEPNNKAGASKQGADAGGASSPEPGPRPERRTLAEVKAIFQKWLYIPDPGFLSVTFAALAANLVKENDPLWLLLVGAPSSGKTEALDSLVKLPNVYPVGTLTEAALLSGTPNHQKAKGASGGLLRKMGEFGILLCKDFTTVLSMGRETRTPLLAALREIYDGAWTRHVGSDGGRELSWRGKCALLGGCTSIIDTHHTVMSAMGERFILYRLPFKEGDYKRQAQKALENVGKEGIIRQEIISSVTGMFAHFDPGKFEIKPEDHERLACLSTFTARARSAIERDGYTREIDLIPDPERPARLVKAYARLLHGLRALGEDEGECWRLISMIARHSIPDVRWRILQFFHDNGMAKSAKTSEIAIGIHYPTNTTRRALEDLTAHLMVIRNKAAKGAKAEQNKGERGGPDDVWEISEYAYDLANDSDVFSAQAIDSSSDTPKNEVVPEKSVANIYS